MLLAPLVPYAYDEVLTTVYLPSMHSAIRAGMETLNLPEPLRFQRALFVDGRSASVYVVVGPRNHCGGLVFYLHERRGIWRFADGSYEGVFSDDGNGDGDVFPPYPADGDF